MDIKNETHIALFQNKEIRKTIHQNEWWFVIEDIVLALIESKDAKQYIQKMKYRDPELAKGYVHIVHTLEIQTVRRQQRRQHSRQRQKSPGKRVKKTGS